MLTHRNDGFSLVELLIAVAAMAIVLLYAFGTFTVQHRTYVVVDQVSETQQNTRAIASLLERDIRNAGFMVPPPAASCGNDNTNGADALFVSDADAILPIDDPAFPIPLKSQVLGASTANVPSLGTMTVNVSDVVMDGVGNETYDTDGDGTRDSDFQVGGGAIVVDVANPDRGVACGFVNSVTPGAVASINVTFVAVQNNPASPPAIPDLQVVPAHAYQIVTVGGVRQIERNGVILAKNVEDLQVAWFYDDNGNGRIDDPGETRGVVGTAYNTTAVDGTDLREIRINVVSRTSADDPSKPGNAGTGQSIENRATGIAGDDGRHRRIHTATVRLRNVSL